MSTDPPDPLRPALITTLFPMLSQPLRNTFRLALIGLTALMIVIALLRLQAPLIGIVALGMVGLYGAYLYASDAIADLPRGTLLVTAGLGLALGVGWAFGTEAAIARESDDALGIPVSVTRVLVTGLAIPLSFLICLLAPVVLIRVWRPGVRESLHGFRIGALSGYCFAAAGTLTRLAPEFATVLDPDDGRSALRMAVAATIQGLAIPITAAAVAGAVGATLWFTRRVDGPPESRWYALTSPAPSVAFAVAAYLGLGVLDFVSPPYGVTMGVYALLAVLSLALLRAVLHSTLLHEAPAGAIATSARSVSPVRLLLAIVVAVALVATASVAVSMWLTPAPPKYVCPPDCGRPAISKPVATNPRFTSEDGEFSVSYPGPATAYEATFEPNGVVLDLLAGDGGTLRLFGQPARGQSAEQITKDLISEHYPDATTHYEIPNAMVGYQLGYGELADVFPSDSIADVSRARVLVMVAVKNDYALVAAAAGPYREFSPDFGSGHPSGANFFLALDMSKYVNSFMWRGDPPR